MKQDCSKDGTEIPRPRLGRPQARHAGDVDKRILAAATALFLEQGFNRASLDQVAANAHVGKTTLYSRYETKEALFETFINHAAADILDGINPECVQGTLEHRLSEAGIALAHATLTPFVLAIMRITLAETVRFPELASKTYHLGFGACVAKIADVLSDALPPDVASRIAERFVEMTLHPLLYHALFKEDLPSLLERVHADMIQVARMLCRELKES